MAADAKQNPDLTRLTVRSRAQWAETLGVSLSTFDLLRKQPDFPTPIQISERRLGWSVGSIAEWQAAKSRMGQAA